ncbi:hypothetical protein GCM10027416_23860 [Okibacterium endophyticum]
MTDTTPELPRSVALAWGVAAAPQRGPKRELSIERIVETAVEIADEGGLAAVSMSAIASRLGFTTMSLYRYVAAKDDLTMLMGEYAMGTPPADEDETGEWRARFLRMANQLLSMYRQHSWLIDIPITGIPLTPNNLAWMDAGIGTLAATPLTHGERVAVMLALTGLIRWQALVYRGYDSESAKQGVAPEELDVRADQLVAVLVTEDRFPALFEAVRAGVFSPESADPFVFGLERFLDGVQHYIDEVSAGRRPAAPPPLLDDDDHVPRDKSVREAARLRREAEAKLREAKRREREAIQKARERAAKAAEKAAAKA